MPKKKDNNKEKKVSDKVDKILKEADKLIDEFKEPKVEEKEYVPGWDIKEDRKHKQVSA